MVTSKIPLAMKDLLSKLNEECIFTVPKYFGYSKVVFGSKDAAHESMDSYLERLTQHMKLYAALIQTEVDGIQNLHGIEEGWKWLARFLMIYLQIYTLLLHLRHSLRLLDLLYTKDTEINSRSY